MSTDKPTPAFPTTPLAPKRCACGRLMDTPGTSCLTCRTLEHLEHRGVFSGRGPW